MADENVKPTDGNAKQWDRLQEMRRKSGTALTDENGKPNDAAAAPGNEQRATKEEIEAEQQRLMAGEPIGGDAADDDDNDDGDDDGDDTGDETVQVAAHERKKPETKKPDEKAPEGCEWVEIDGARVAVDASLAAAYRDSQTTAATATAAAKDDQLVDRIVERVTANLPKPTTAADAAATRAADTTVADAPLEHPMPDGKLAITDPDAYNAQLQAHIDEKSARAAAKAIADKEARDAAANQTRAQENLRQQEAWAREQLGIQFYRQFKVLDDPAVKPLVDVLLKKKFDEVIASGVVNKPMAPKEAEAMKMKAFNDVAAEATRSIVKLRGGTGPAASATAPEPPKVVTGQSNKGPRAKATPPPAKPKEKYPSGSVSAMLHAHKSKKEGSNQRA